MSLSRLSSFRLSQLKPRSSLWRTTWVVMMVVVASSIMWINFIWQTLYLPQLNQHALATAKEIRLHEQIRQIQAPLRPDWFKDASTIELVTDPSKFPDVQSKLGVDFISGYVAETMSARLKQPVQVYFKFKPTPVLWIQTADMGGDWYRQPLEFYDNYDVGVVIAWLLMIPVLSLIAIVVLVRQLNRPLERLKLAAKNYLQNGDFSRLPTHTGPGEIREANKAFNLLFDTLKASEAERNLMLAGISHDLRTPLTRMRLSAEFLQDEATSEGLIYDINDMDAILEQFISFMRDGSDELMSLTNINSILDEVKVQFSDLALIEVSAPELPKVPLRALSIKRLISNLVTNAIRYGEPPVHVLAFLSSSKVVVEGEPDKTLRWLNLVVRDEGGGVDESQIDQLLEPFHRGESARTTQGTGLGLAIVKRITELHGGTLMLKNRKNGGLEAKVCLPWHDTSVQTEAVINRDDDQD